MRSCDPTVWITRWSNDNEAPIQILSRWNLLKKTFGNVQKCWHKAYEKVMTFLNVSIRICYFIQGDIRPFTRQWSDFKIRNISRRR